MSCIFVHLGWIDFAQFSSPGADHSRGRADPPPFGCFTKTTLLLHTRTRDFAGSEIFVRTARALLITTRRPQVSKSFVDSSSRPYRCGSACQRQYRRARWRDCCPCRLKRTTHYSTAEPFLHSSNDMCTCFRRVPLQKRKHQREEQVKAFYTHVQYPAQHNNLARDAQPAASRRDSAVCKMQTAGLCLRAVFSTTIALGKI